MAAKRSSPHPAHTPERNKLATADDSKPSYCSVPVMPVRALPAGIDANRARLILAMGNKWVNATVLHYYFFDQETDGREIQLNDGTTEWRPWTTTEEEKELVRRAFTTWKEVGIGLEFREVDSRSEAEIRIGFERDDGAWSYIGRDILGIGVNDRTMNFGWNLLQSAREFDTALHEIGHTLGFPHEHQNPIAGIEWDEDAVYASLGGPPNNWDREKIEYNILRKLRSDEVQASKWDPDSVMHYPFEAGLIKKPEGYRNGLNPAGGLSARDRTWVRKFYPPLAAADYLPLRPLASVDLELDNGGQQNFLIEPTETRNYEFRTFGSSDAVMVLFEDIEGEWRFLAGEDDSGEERNTHLQAKLFSGRRYALRLRLYAQQGSQVAVMMW